ncbi:hypothetical protein RHSIM_Rhsim07G0216500 [Rhododendron simsii]|uniref:Uncharacterized protein n=1 Tax=Rhododendron simsii TaxID=118357 RepID=A0A834GRA4_RHOSS|nr:hypothetical protein RHSIM_Rhsim07G0216500 [Rhododendron simsii]
MLEQEESLFRRSCVPRQGGDVTFLVILGFNALQVLKLALAAEYFLKMGVEGKRFRPTGRLMDTFQQRYLSENVLLLMGTALNVHIPGPPDDVVVDALSEELHLGQQRIAEITEMNYLAVLAGDFLLSRACVASLKNTEVFFFPLEFAIF